jgi:hypothetical protein
VPGIPAFRSYQEKAWFNRKNNGNKKNARTPQAPVNEYDSVDPLINKPAQPGLFYFFQALFRHNSASGRNPERIRYMACGSGTATIPVIIAFPLI